MEYFGNVLIGISALLPIGLCFLARMLLAHMTFQRRRLAVFIIASSCLLSSLSGTLITDNTDNEHDLQLPRCTDLAWSIQFFSNLKAGPYDIGWRTICPFMANLGQWMLFTHALLQRKINRNDTRSSLIVSSWALMTIVLGFHGAGLYMLIHCSKVYSSVVSSCWVVVTALFTIITYILNLWRDPSPCNEPLLPPPRFLNEENARCDQVPFLTIRRSTSCFPSLTSPNIEAKKAVAVISPSLGASALAVGKNAVMAPVPTIKKESSVKACGEPKAENKAEKKLAPAEAWENPKTAGIEAGLKREAKLEKRKVVRDEKMSDQTKSIVPLMQHRKRAISNNPQIDFSGAPTD